MDILRQQQDEQTDNLWYVKIGGIAGDGLYRLADLTTDQEPAAWLATHQAEAQSAIDAGVYNADIATRRQWFEDHADQVDMQIVRIVRALALVTLDEINLLRREHGQAERTTDQLIAAIKARL